MAGHNVNRTPGDSELDGPAGTREHYLQLDGQEATMREYARVVGALPHGWSEQEIAEAADENASRPFRIMR